MNRKPVIWIALSCLAVTAAGATWYFTRDVSSDYGQTFHFEVTQDSTPPPVMLGPEDVYAFGAGLSEALNLSVMSGSGD